MPTENEKENNPWKWGIFYYNPADPRIIVPKRVATFGWTINFANKISWLIAAAMVVLIVWAIVTKQARVNLP